ncbi:hypothetical protein ASC65_14395 [Brevundimonas sp. Root1279]|nr:hypothetical protein ASC65_14395 [Brevundimonas sp. Root1279]
MGLTRRQADCLKAIEDLTVDGVSPTYSEIADRLDIEGKSSIHRLITALEERGLVRRLANRRRSLEVIRPAPSPLRASEVADGICASLIRAKALEGDLPWPRVRQLVLECLR